MIPRILYLFPDETKLRVAEVARRAAPTERLYGTAELCALGYEVDISDSRWQGVLGKMRRRTRRMLEAPSIATYREMRRADVVIVKDGFSPSLAICALLAQRPLLFMDAMFDLPRSYAARKAVRFCISKSSLVCCFSKHQAALWSASLGICPSKLHVMPYCIDTDFYPILNPAPRQPPYVLAVGRDIGRDYEVLFRACVQTGVQLKLVTLPYLVPKAVRESPLVQILEHLSYESLFQLYSNAAVSVIPLRSNITYPSGIRAMLESAALSIPTIASNSEVLREYLSGESVVYVPPGDSTALAEAIRGVVLDPMRYAAMASSASRQVRRNFSMSTFVAHLQRAIAIASAADQ